MDDSRCHILLLIHTFFIWMMLVEMPFQILAAVALFSVHWAASGPKTLTSVSSFWGSLLHRSLGCICNGRQSQHRALRPDSLLLTAWHRVCLEPLDTLSCSRPLGKTTDRPPNTPTCRCHLKRGEGEGEADFNSKGISKYSCTEEGKESNVEKHTCKQCSIFFISIAVILNLRKLVLMYWISLVLYHACSWQYCYVL